MTFQSRISALPCLQHFIQLGQIMQMKTRLTCIYTAPSGKGGCRYSRHPIKRVQAYKCLLPAWQYHNIKPLLVTLSNASVRTYSIFQKFLIWFSDGLCDFFVANIFVSTCICGIQESIYIYYSKLLLWNFDKASGYEVKLDDMDIIFWGINLTLFHFVTRHVWNWLKRLSLKRRNRNGANSYQCMNKL